MRSNSLSWKQRRFDDLSLRELYAILRARQEVFAVEQAICYADPDGHDEAAVHLWAEDDSGALAAYARWFAPGIRYEGASFGRLLTLASHRQTGAGREAVRRTLAAIEEAHGAVAVYIHAQTYLVKFYESFGFTRVGEDEIFEGLLHTEMVRNAHGQ